MATYTNLGISGAPTSSWLLIEPTTATSVSTTTIFRPNNDAGGTFTRLTGDFVLDGTGTIVLSGTVASIERVDAAGTTIYETITGLSLDVTTLSAVGFFQTVLAGADSFTGAGGNDTPAGYGGNDTLDGGAGIDTAVFTFNILNSDIRRNVDGSITVDATNAGNGLGVDTLTNVERLQFGTVTYTIDGTSAASPTALALGGAGDDTATGGSFNDIAFGGDGNDLAIGNGGNDTAVGGAGNDTAQGGAGNDFALGGAGDDRIEGGAGFDFAAYAIGNADTLTGAITVDLAAGTVTGDATVGTDTLVSVEAVRGSNYADTLSAVGFSGSSVNVGSNGTSNDFEGMGGDDTIIGNGNTRVSYQNAFGGVTVDIAAGTGDGGSTVGHDVFSGVNQVRGSNFSDSLVGSSANETFEGLSGDDTMQGGGGFDRVRYDLINPGSVGIAVDLAAGTVTGRDATATGVVGNDLLQSIELVRGTTAADTYSAVGFNSGSSGTFNEFEGMGGNDTITGNGNTRLAFTQATGAVTVTFSGGGTGTASGSDIGTDSFTGVNQVRGSNQNDTFTGSNSSETFEGYAGNDSITGGGGFDQARYDNNNGNAPLTVGMTYSMAAGTASAIGGNANTAANHGTDTLRSIESIRGTNMADVYDATGYGGAGALNVGNSGTLNEFEGGGGNDTITGNGNTRISYFNSTGAVTVDLGAGTVFGGDVGVDTLTLEQIPIRRNHSRLL